MVLERYAPTVPGYFLYFPSRAHERRRRCVSSSSGQGVRRARCEVATKHGARADPALRTDWDAGGISQNRWTVAQLQRRK